MLPEIRFIHTADLHLDSKMQGLSRANNVIQERLRNSTFRALDNLVEQAIRNQVDFILIAGDIFDENRQHMKSLVRLRDAFDQLNEHGIQVYMQYGNHDFVTEQRRMVYPDNVHLFEEEQVETKFFVKNEKPIAAIHGFSYTKRNVTENMTAMYKSAPGLLYQIGMLHGSTGKAAEHHAYAPFLIEELKDKQFDYWALGHIHKREVLAHKPPIIYPGNTQGRHRKETGEKGCYLVRLCGEEAEWHFLPLHDFVFHQADLFLGEITEPYQLEIKLREAKQQWYADWGEAIILLTLHGSAEVLGKWERDGEMLEVIDSTNDSIGPLMHIADYRLRQQIEWDEAKLMEGSDFIAELLQSLAVQEEQLQPILHELVNKREIRRAIGELSESDLAEIFNEAKQLLLQALLEQKEQQI